MRSVALDTETTGRDVEQGDRIIEIGAVEMEDGVRTGRTFHCYINPECEISAAATRVHGLSRSDLEQSPLFEDVAESFLAFIGDSELVIHNASFDMGFLNHELSLCGRPPLQNSVCDTLVEARRRWPGARVSLDALCNRFSIDRSQRTKHGALVDADLLAQVYLEFKGGRAPTLHLEVSGDEASEVKSDVRARSPWPQRPALTASELEAGRHAEFVTTIKDNLWDPPDASPGAPKR